MLSRRNLLVLGASAAAIGSASYLTWPKLNTYDEEMSRIRSPLTTEPRVAELVRYATLAANGHNTQPWKFRVSANSVTILPDYTRRTSVVDPDDHHLFVSLGCAAENLLIAGQAHGRVGDMHIQESSVTKIQIELLRAAPNETPLYSAIPHRQSTRSVYDGTPLQVDELQLLQNAAKQEGVTLTLFTDPNQIENVLDYVVQGNSAQMNDPAFIAELRDWIRFTPDQALTSADGLFGACSGNPVVPAWIGKPAFNLVFKEASENDKYRDQIRSSAGIAVFTGDKADPEHWIKVGRSFQRFALQATALGIRNAHINQPIEVPEIRAEFSKWLGIGNTRPDLVVRFGKADPMPMSARRPVAEVLI